MIGDCLAQARQLTALGRHSEACDLLQDRLARTTDSLVRPEDLGDLCRTLGAALTASGRAADAIQAYQEAADAYGAAPGCAALQAECAQEVLAGVRKLRAEPQNRLTLLIARLDREVLSLRYAEGADRRRGELMQQTAEILQRRGRPQEAEPRYREAIKAFHNAPDAALAEAKCLMKLAGLCLHDLDRLDDAAAHYRAARDLARAMDPQTDDAEVLADDCEAVLGNLGAATPP